MSHERDERIKRFGQIPPEVDPEATPDDFDDSRIEAHKADEDEVVDSEAFSAGPGDSVTQEKAMAELRQFAAIRHLTELLAEKLPILQKLGSLEHDLWAARAEFAQIKRRVNEVCDRLHID